jgi:hypothetical protein
MKAAIIVWLENNWMFNRVLIYANNWLINRVLIHC